VEESLNKIRISKSEIRNNLENQIFEKDRFGAVSNFTDSCLFRASVRAGLAPSKFGFNKLRCLDPSRTGILLDMIRKTKNRTRRHFIKVSAVAGATVALGPRWTSLLAEKAVKPMHILILGGTGFTGPYQVRYAMSRGHKVTTFNRGKTHPGELPGEVEQLVGDRNGKLDVLRNRQWDLVIDNPTTLPAWVRDAAQILKGNVDRYVFISTISVYQDSKTGPDENAPLQKYEGADPYKETLEAMRASGFKTYGPLKALSEKEAEKWFPGKTLIIRPGLIVGPRDESDRFTYWPVRIDRGSEVLAPGSPNDSVQFIDARDLAEWTIRMAENREMGIYNATGPAKPLGIGAMLDGIKNELKSNADFTWVNEKFLTEQKVQAWSDMPVWAGAEDGVTKTNISRALSKGLTFRPLGDTARDTLAWFKSLPQDRQSHLKAGLTPEREAEALRAWHARK
jgi:2'-hydroxyisoflavone reductase